MDYKEKYLKECKERLDNHPKIKRLKEIFDKCNGIELVGGAVIDIMALQEPKDFDLIGHIPSIHDKYLLEAGFFFEYETKTARTWMRDKITIQTLKTSRENFDFTISQASYNLKKGELKLDEISWDRRILIPTPIAFEDKSHARNSLSRVKHWQNKGYKLPTATLKSLKRVAKISLLDRIIRFFGGGNKES